MKRYDVVIGGNRTTLQLSDEDAKARGLVPQAAVEPAAEQVDTKAKTPANKSRRPANKRAAAAAQAFTAKAGDA